VHKNLILDDVTMATQELGAYARCGGGALCEMSVIGMRTEKHSPSNLADLARATGLNVISACGFYWAKLLPEWVWPLSVQEMADILKTEVVGGVRGVACGVMYVACSHPMKDLEMKALQAAVQTHKETGKGLLMLHLCI